ncbi:MAG: hypothetical protein K2X69_01095 [Silvanigrellaceae bacterium]|nr:hypothetical protein [Silvanigrellaceae bacterium]
MKNKMICLKIFEYEYLRFKKLFEDYALENINFLEDEESEEENETCLTKGCSSDHPCSDNCSDDEESDEDIDVDQYEYIFGFAALKIGIPFITLLHHAYKQSNNIEIDDFEKVAAWLLKEKIVDNEEDSNLVGILLTFVQETYDLDDDFHPLCYTDSEKRECIVPVEQFIQSIEVAHSVVVEFKKRLIFKN